MGRNDSITKVSYFYSPNYAQYYYNKDHPMKPHRLSMTYHLTMAYGLHHYMEVHQPIKAQPTDLATFHTHDYINFLLTTTPSEAKLQSKSEGMTQFNLSEDCPVFEGLYDYCCLYSGASLQGARRLNSRQSDVAINWAGGLHHAKRDMASGFCYINDLNLAILELLKCHRRVLYLDIDIHHGDGVEEAFYLTDRVMTVSFHRHGDGFFPGTGALRDQGLGTGRYYNINVPLKGGIDDQQYQQLFRDVMTMVMQVYRPEAVVMQCGADSLKGDRIGNFNLTIPLHAECLKFMKSWGVPLLVTGGGGYTKTNVAKCWTYETAVLIGEERSVKNKPLPIHAYSTYYSNTRGTKLTDVEEKRGVHHLNENTAGDLSRTRQLIFNNLRQLVPAPNAYLNEGGFAPGLQYIWDYPEQNTIPFPPNMMVDYYLGEQEQLTLQEYAEERQRLLKLQRDGQMQGG